MIVWLLEPTGTSSRVRTGKRGVVVGFRWRDNVVVRWDSGHTYPVQGSMLESDS